MPELVKVGNDPNADPELRNASRANFHFRLVEVAMMLLLPFLAVALAVPPKRSSSALGVFLSIVMVVTYHKINEYAEALGSLGKVDPIIALWTPFLVFAALIMWIYHILAHKPGGQPIGGLERVAARTVGWFRKWFRLGRRKLLGAQY
jgi:lipopolysaccharide export system permease protein